MAADPRLSSELYGRYHDHVKTLDVTVSGTFPTPLPLHPLAGRRDLLVYNFSGTTIFVGGSNVQYQTGIPVTSGTIFTAPLGRATLYGITGAVGTTVSGVRVLEIA